MKTYKKRHFVYAAIGATLIAVAIYAGNILATNNFHAIVPGEAYRSAQVEPEEIIDYKNRYNIRSIISLRPRKPGKEWYEAEITTSEQMGITYINFPMDSGDALSDEEMAVLVDKMKTAEKPVLIHCENGANRTGLASALYLLGVKNIDAEEADDQLSVKYGHIHLGIFDTKAMRESFDDYIDGK